MFLNKVLDVSNEVFIGNLLEAWWIYPLNLTYYTYLQFNRSLTWRNKPAWTDSTLFSSKCTSFTSCCAYQHIAWSAVKPDLLELQSSNICVLKADIDHHCPRSNFPMGPFKVHVATSRGMWGREERGKKTPQDLDAKRMVERSIYYKIKFQILPHFPLSPVQNTVIAQGNILPSTPYGAVITP